jgi:DNA-binding helix-hairpin-helix protein with protein kinase domain
LVIQLKTLNNTTGYTFRILGITAVVAAMFAIPTTAEPSSKSEKLVALRFEVDEKAQRLESVRSRIASEKAALESQVADLEILLGKERIRKSTLLQIERDQQRAREKQTSEAARYLEPSLFAAKTIRAQIEDSLPFKQAERLAVVDEIVADLKGNKVDAATALTRLWRIVEDELKLTSEVGLHRQPVTLNGETMLADVVRIGMSALYFKISKGCISHFTVTRA